MAKSGWYNGKWHGFGTGLGKYLKTSSGSSSKPKNYWISKSNNKNSLTYKVANKAVQYKTGKKGSTNKNKTSKNNSAKKTSAIKNISKNVKKYSSSVGKKMKSKSSSKTSKKSTTVSQKKKTVKKASAKKKTTKTNKKPNTKTKKKTSATTSKNSKKSTTVEQVVSQSPIYNITNNYNYYGTMGGPLNKTYSYSGTDLWKIYGEYITWKYYMTWKDQQDTK